MSEKQTIDSTYKKLRWQIIVTTFMSYAVFYISRKNFTYAAPSLMEDLGMTTAQFGLMSSMFYILYGVSKFSSGLVADRINPRLMLGPALILIGVLNFWMGSSNNISVLKYSRNR
ncbi:MFS transporter [Endozoicomonas sp. Mp262]|uniref:MFS transporter n=1 Tax=Endozoicomonas sp. Mp262 TaxID=2919499 RepID=UPI0021DAAB29